MPRLQILELPEGSDDDRPPFALVIDQVDMTLADALATAIPAGAPFADMATRLGARTVLVFGETIEIPANDLPADEHSIPVTIHVEADTTLFDEQIAKAAHAAARYAGHSSH
ncbi:hypothetical protein ACFRFJ_16000 [Streptomyces hydrogenans]|uniref:hypothetical protein n=1 Tax=Streptomyces hydrogenans TaxID=1873719 RepID=UPI003685C597